MAMRGTPSRFTSELLEEHAAALGEISELAADLGWADQARTLVETVSAVKRIALQIRSGQIETRDVPGFPQRNY